MLNNGGRDTSLRDVQKLQQQLADIKEQVEECRSSEVNALHGADCSSCLKLHCLLMIALCGEDYTTL